MVSSSCSAYNCLMDFKGHNIDVRITHIFGNDYVPDQQRLNLGYLLDPS
jgi:hypothetical protein